MPFGARARVAKGEHRDSPLGRCIAAALAQARFPPFDSARVGFFYTIRTE